jgi:hypothetical protein
MQRLTGRSLRDRVRAQVTLEALEDRAVPSATTLDLTTRGAEGMINDAQFTQCDAQPTGSGVIHAFLRVQTNAGVEHGYNTNARPLQFDENKSPVFTRALKLGGVPVVNVDGVNYREFLLDINQKASAPLLTLDELRIFLGDAPDLTGYDTNTETLAGETAIYDLDAGGDNAIKLNYRLNHGSGSGDMFARIPDSRFAGATVDTYVYLYSRFGEGNGNNAGFEEWAVRTTTTPVAPPGFSSLAGFVYIDANTNGLRDADEVGIEGVALELHGVDDLGNTVVQVAFTDQFGAYKFAGLRPGTYSILENQPERYLDGQDSIGTQGGQVDTGYLADRLFDIILGAGVNGEDNNFGELFMGS